MNHKNIFLVYAPGMAGNHVANLICLNRDFAHREEQIYEGDWKTHKLQENQHLRNLTMFPDKRNVVLGHVDEMYHLDWDFEATDSQLVNIEHDGDEFFKQRTQKMFSTFNKDSNHRTYMHLSHQKFYFFYNSDVIRKLFDAPSVLTLSTSQISNFEGMYDFIVNTLKIEIDRNKAAEMHTKWRENNQKWLLDL